GLAQPGVELLALSPKIAIESTKLPPLFHGDPADRILVARARVLNLSLVTRDHKIVQHAKDGLLNVINA
ncbi:hypothetical protein ABTM51_21075, partial [Acinetobacter baumannii]